MKRLCVGSMKIHGSCRCGNCEVVIAGLVDFSELQPRFCDCKYCQQHPSAMVSHPKIEVFVGPKSSMYIAFNGSGQATFYHCKSCDQLLAVGAILDGASLGAVNAFLFGDLGQFAAPISIQPWRLSSTEKAARWPKVWGRLTVCEDGQVLP